MCIYIYSLYIYIYIFTVYIYIYIFTAPLSPGLFLLQKQKKKINICLLNISYNLKVTLVCAIGLQTCQLLGFSLFLEFRYKTWRCKSQCIEIIRIILPFPSSHISLRLQIFIYGFKNNNTLFFKALYRLIASIKRGKGKKTIITVTSLQQIITDRHVCLLECESHTPSVSCSLLVSIWQKKNALVSIYMEAIIQYLYQLCNLCQ